MNRWLEEEGVVTVEYVIVLSMVVVGCVIAVIGLGPLLLARLCFLRAWLLTPLA